LASLAAGATLASAVNATFFIAAVFGCVLLVALFVFRAARQDAHAADAAAHAETKLADVQSSLGETSSWIVLPAYARVNDVTRVLFQRQNLYPVVQCAEVVGVISKAQLLWAIGNGHGDRLIADMMNHTRGDGLQLSLAMVQPNRN
jgi:hypothetical protein